VARPAAKARAKKVSLLTVVAELAAFACNPRCGFLYPLLCPACALCQEARTAAAWEREKKEQKAAAAGANGDEADEEAPSLPLPLEAPAVPPSFDRGGGGEGAV